MPQSGSQSPASTDQRRSAIMTHENNSRSWMDPDAKSKDLLYVTNPGANEVLVYSYPQDKLVGTLGGLLLQFLCRRRVHG